MKNARKITKSATALRPKSKCFAFEQSRNIASAQKIKAPSVIKKSRFTSGKLSKNKSPTKGADAELRDEYRPALICTNMQSAISKIAK